MSINYNLNVSVSKGKFSQNFFASSETATMNGTGMMATTLMLDLGTQAVNTSAATSLGYAFIRNLALFTSQTATVSFGRLDGTTLHEVVRLRPGEASWLRLAPGDYGARAQVQVGPLMPLLVQILED